MLRLICLLVCCTVFVRGGSEILRDDSASESSLEIALVQFTAENGNKTANLQQIEYYAQQAAENGSSLLVFPELSLVGYSIIAETNIVHLAEPQNGPSMQRIQEIAQQYNINIAYGYMELGSTNDCNQKLPPFQNNIYDSYAIISSSGELILNYRKTHLALGAEERLFTRGGVIGPVVEVNGVKIGVMICIEVYTPEIARYLALEGAQMILAPTANAYPACDPSEVIKGYYNVPAYVMVPARAGENHIPVCYVNYYDPDNVYFTFNGMTVLYGPEGTLMAWGGYNSSTVIYNSVPIKLTTPQSGRRPNLYSGICSPNSYSYCSDEANCIPVSPYP